MAKKNPRTIGKSASGFSADVYLNAAKEHQPLGNKLFLGGSYVQAIYIAGLSVECLFRAYHAKKVGLEFKKEHDLRVWAKDSKFMEILPTDQKKAIPYSAAVITLYTLWDNSHKYRSAKSLREQYPKQGAHKRGKGDDFLRDLAREVVHASDQIIQLGVVKWVS